MLARKHIESNLFHNPFSTTILCVAFFKPLVFSNLANSNLYVLLSVLNFDLKFVCLIETPIWSFLQFKSVIEKVFKVLHGKLQNWNDVGLQDLGAISAFRINLAFSFYGNKFTANLKLSKFYTHRWKIRISLYKIGDLFLIRIKLSEKVCNFRLTSERLISHSHCCPHQSYRLIVFIVINIAGLVLNLIQFTEMCYMFVPIVFIELLNKFLGEFFVTQNIY